jgi:hypothetical protein
MEKNMSKENKEKRIMIDDQYPMEDTFNQQIKKDKTLPKSYLGTQSKPERANTGVKAGDVDNQSADNHSKANRRKDEKQNRLS